MSISWFATVWNFKKYLVVVIFITIILNTLCETCCYRLQPLVSAVVNVVLL